MFGGRGMLNETITEKEMKRKLLAGLAVGAMMFGMVGMASATTIDFEDNPGGFIGSYYSTNNVIFDDSWVLYGNDPDYPTHSGDYSVLNNSNKASIQFITPVSQVSAYFNAYMGDLTWEAFNSSGDLL